MRVEYRGKIGPPVARGGAWPVLCGWLLAATVLVLCSIPSLAMAAAELVADSAPLADDSFWGPDWDGMALFGPVPMLVFFLVSSFLYLRMRSKAQRLTQSLRKTNEKLLRANVKLKRIAFRDPLTGIANRALLEYRLHRAIARADSTAAGAQEGGARRVGLLFIDLDGFKPINDVEGHAAGDALLCEVALRLSHMTRKSDTLARVGGDEFVLLLGCLTSVDDAVAMASRVQKAIGRPFDLPGKTVSISSSIGLALYPDHGKKEKLMAAADAAMYTAKRAGGNSYAIFQESMHQGIAAQFDLQQALRRAVANGELVLYYQPKIDTRTGRIRSLEALARWNHPKFGLISPRVFIPLAERFGLISEIGDWVIDEACRQTAQWASQRRYMRVSINISGYQIFHSPLAQYVREAIARHRIRPEQLVFEITESVAMEDDKTTMAVIAELTKIGAKISIDDFGTGFSSLAYLKKFDIDYLKVDASFVRGLAHDENDRIIVEAIIVMAHKLGIKTIAEGVETPEQRAILGALQCDYAQGYLFSRPLPADAFERWMQDGAISPAMPTKSNNK
jgi:diguanylate cyclase (GGDEF)-like protein